MSSMDFVNTKYLNLKPKTSVATGLKELNSTATDTYYEQDILYTSLQDLVNGQFRAWYCQAFGRLGHQRVLELASLARADGKDPRRYFSFLLRKELNHPQ